MSRSQEVWRETLDGLRLMWRRSPLPAFFSWWGGELAACLPQRWVASWRRLHVWYLLSLDDNGMQIYRDGETCGRIDATQARALQQASMRETLSGADPRDVRVALCLRPSQVLRRAVLLPAPARANLKRVLGYEMSRQTPFRTEEVAFAVRDLGRTHAGGVRVELVAVPKATLRSMLDRLRALDLHVDAVDAFDGTRRLGVNMLDARMRPHHRNPRRRLNIVLAALAIVLLALALGQWLHNRRTVVTTMQNQVHALRAQAHQVATLRRHLVERMSAAGFLARRHAASPAVIDVLADLTRRIPDNAWLQRLGIDKSGHVVMQGESPRATQLLKRIAASPYLSDPGFQGAIRADTRTGKERFYITAQMSNGLPAPATTTAKSTDAQTRPN